jgi:hypothetical protein
MKSPKRFPVMLLIVILATPAFSQAIRREEVRFKGGTNSATIKDRIKGSQTVDYLLVAKAEQTMTVVLKPSNASCYFNIMGPADATALFNGSISGYTFKGMLPADGQYTVRVYLMRNAARRAETADYAITFVIEANARD